MKSHWKKFYPCDCHGEGIMLSNEDFDYEDDNPFIDLAYFRNTPQFSDGRMCLKDRIRWAWNLLWTGEPFCDMVMLRQDVAGELGKDLIKFSKKKIKRAKRKKKIQFKIEPHEIGTPIRDIYHLENAL